MTTAKELAAAIHAANPRIQATACGLEYVMVDGRFVDAPAGAMQVKCVLTSAKAGSTVVRNVTDLAIEGATIAAEMQSEMDARAKATRTAIRRERS